MNCHISIIPQSSTGHLQFTLYESRNPGSSSYYSSKSLKCQNNAMWAEKGN